LEFEETMIKKECIKCFNIEGIDTNFQKDIQIGDDGICSFCNEWNINRNDFNLMRNEALTEMEALFLEVKKRNNKYDALLMLSGGKDSIAALIAAKETYKLKILAVTVDKGIHHEGTHSNIKKITNSLGVDHIMFSIPSSISKKIVEFGLKTMSQDGIACMLCGSITVGVIGKLQVKYDIPLVMNGSDIWEIHTAFMHNLMMKMPVEKNHLIYIVPHRSEITYNYKLKKQMIRSIIRKNAPKETRRDLIKEFNKLFEETVMRYALTPDEVEIVNNTPNISIPAILYERKEEILEEIKRYGWEKPKSVSAELISSDCLFGYLINSICTLEGKRNQWSYRVRANYISKEKAEKELKLGTKTDAKSLAEILKSLGISTIDNVFKKGWENESYSHYYKQDLIKEIQELLKV